jgi:hypothetical protein
VVHESNYLGLLTISICIDIVNKPK